MRRILRSYVHFLGISCFLLWSINGYSRFQQGIDSTPHLTELILIPHIGNDHQFNLNYTVAHLLALLDAVHPDALVLYDEPEWVKQGCLWQTGNPAAHAVLNYSLEQSIPLYGVGLTAEAFTKTNKSIEDYQKSYPDIESIRIGTRTRLDRETARFSREFRNPPSLEALFNHILPEQYSKVPEQVRTRIKATAQRIVNGIEPLVLGKIHRRIALVLDPVLIELMSTLLQKRNDVQLSSPISYLPLKPEAIERRMDFKNTTWILSGLLDEWFGMWAPQCFPTQMIDTFITRLESIAPSDPVTRFLKARWLMQNRDFAGAKPILENLTVLKEDARFPFPINGKWIRPPWSSVRDKAKLNLAFVYDYHNERERALNLYKELLTKEDVLDTEARASGYVYDDIRWVVESYIREAFTGMPEEAFRHFRLKTKIPKCATSQPSGKKRLSQTYDDNESKQK